MSNLVDQIAANALEAQKLTRKHFVVELDFSIPSLKELEGQFETVSFNLRGGLSEENIALLRRTWGTYLGESIRRKVGGEWVTVNDGSGEQIVLRCPAGDLRPLEQVEKRLRGDTTANVFEYAKKHVS